MHLTGCPSIFSRVTGQRKIIKFYLCTPCRYMQVYGGMGYTASDPAEYTDACAHMAEIHTTADCLDVRR
jgi:hypothetical protein